MAKRRTIKHCALHIFMHVVSAVRRGTIPVLCTLPMVSAVQAAETAGSSGDVTVVATRTEKGEFDAPASVTVISREVLERSLSHSVVDVLDDIPGVSAGKGPRRTGVKPVIRGLGGERVVMRLDGARQNFNAEHKGRLFVDPLFLKKIDALRGPGSALFGTGALGGVVDMETVSATDFLKPGQNMGAQVSAGYAGANDEKRGTTLIYGKASDYLALLAGMSGRTSADVRHGDGSHLRYSAEKNRSGLVKATLTPTPFHNVSISAFHSDGDEKATSNAEAAASTSSYPVNRDTKQTTYAVSWRYADPVDSLFNIRSTLYHTETDVTERRISDGRHDMYRQKVWGVDVANTSRFATGQHLQHSLTYGVEHFVEDQIGRRDGSPLSGLYPDAEMTTIGVFVQDEVTLPKGLILTVGARRDMFDISATGQGDHDGMSTSPKASLAWAITPEVQPYVSYAEAFRAPTLSYLYNSGVHYSMGPMNNNFVPNPNLRPEKAHNIEVGMNLKFDGVVQPKDHLRVRAAGFENRLDDYIEQVHTATTTTSRNVPKAFIRGLELEAQYDAGLVFGSVVLSSLKGDNETDSKPLEDIPAAKLVTTFGTRLPGTDLEAGWRLHAVAPQNRAEKEEKKTSGYAVHDLFVSWVPKAFNDALRLNISVDNLFDRYYRPHESVIPAAGRDVRLSMSVTF